MTQIIIENAIKIYSPLNLFPANAKFKFEVLELMKILSLPMFSRI